MSKPSWSNLIHWSYPMFNLLLNMWYVNKLKLHHWYCNNQMLWNSSKHNMHKLTYWTTAELNHTQTKTISVWISKLVTIKNHKKCITNKKSVQLWTSQNSLLKSHNQNNTKIKANKENSKNIQLHNLFMPQWMLGGVYWHPACFAACIVFFYYWLSPLLRFMCWFLMSVCLNGAIATEVLCIRCF